MINVLIIEDELYTRKELRVLIKDVDGITIDGEADDAEQAEQYIIKYKPKLIISDIRLLDTTVFHLLDRLLDIGVSLPYVILISAHVQDHFDEAINHKATIIACLPKPVRKEKLIESINRAKNIIENDPIAVNKRKITINHFAFVSYKGSRITQSGQWFFQIDSIKYIEASGGNVIITFEKNTFKTETVYTIDREYRKRNFYELTDETAVYHMGLKEVYERLDPRHFIRVSQSHIINIRFIDKVLFEDNEYTIILQGGYKCPLVGPARVIDVKSYFSL